jgi:hypothetical protein
VPDRQPEDQAGHAAGNRFGGGGEAEPSGLGVRPNRGPAEPETAQQPPNQPPQPAVQQPPNQPPQPAARTARRNRPPLEPPQMGQLNRPLTEGEQGPNG